MNYKKIFVTLLFGGCLVSTYGQEFEIVEFVEKPMDESAQIHQRKDANGTPCAMVRVLLKEPGAKFEGSYVVGDPDDDSKCYVYKNDSIITTTVYQKNDKGFSMQSTGRNKFSETFMIDPKKQTLSIHKRRVPVKISPKARYFDLLGRYKFTK